MTLDCASGHAAMSGQLRTVALVTALSSVGRHRLPCETQMDGVGDGGGSRGYFVAAGHESLLVGGSAAAAGDDDGDSYSGCASLSYPHRQQSERHAGTAGMVVADLLIVFSS